MPAITKIIKKDLKLLVRSKSSALIVILGPLLVIFLVGIAFDTMSQFALNIGTYSSSYNDLTNSFIENLQEQRYKVEKIESEELCIDLIKQQKLHTCIVFPSDMNIQTGTSEIMFYVDYSKMNLIYAVLDSLSTKIKEASTDISLDLTQAILKALETTRQETAVLERESNSLKANTEKIQTDAIVKIDQIPVENIKLTAEEVKAALIEKIASAKEQINDTNDEIDSLDELNESEKEDIKEDVSQIDEYITEMYDRIEDPNNATTSDYASMLEQINSLNSKFAQLKETLDQSSASISGSASKIAQSSPILAPGASPSPPT